MDGREKERRWERNERETEDVIERKERERERVCCFKNKNRKVHKKRSKIKIIGQNKIIQK